MKTNKVKSVFRERDILIYNKTCKFLPKLYHTFQDEEYLYIVMEFVSNGTLLNRISRQGKRGFPKYLIQFLAAQLVLTLEYLQSKNIAHRDIKPSNIMIDEQLYIKLVDFGDAKVVDKYEWLDDNKSDISKIS